MSISDTPFILKVKWILFCPNLTLETRVSNTHHLGPKSRSRRTQVEDKQLMKGEVWIKKVIRCLFLGHPGTGDRVSKSICSDCV